MNDNNCNNKGNMDAYLGPELTPHHTSRVTTISIGRLDDAACNHLFWALTPPHLAKALPLKI
jgi:hypothetical protein